ncbi:ATP-binding cassette domain-containing protein [Lactobacillus panisapium]|uniref:ABC transporter ATP-binding protein n=1 Tax=Lactobacillus panisapium TaxID=2012495 RepID=UPI001C6A5C79|nr:ATP-binding cassette domain-containing protein [Lactobacillus panisapium]QYN57083.1 ATP-binding cassette domain-containing protein [Lactobacillus panisapium]
MSYLELTNVTKKINDETVLNDINLKIDQGKIIGFVGTNGSGKTMLFKAILGLIKISSGQVILKGQEVGLNTERQVNVGAIIETPGFIKSYTALKNLQYLASIKNIVGKDEIIAAMKVFDLEKVRDKKVKKFSLGMRQKLAIVQAFMEKQELLVLDEPTNGLDKESVQIFENLMKQLRARGVTVLLASHDDRVIKSVADEYYQIDGGKIVSD